MFAMHLKKVIMHMNFYYFTMNLTAWNSPESDERLISSTANKKKSLSYTFSDNSVHRLL